MKLFMSLTSGRLCVENQTTRKVKKLRTNNGLEFFSEEFDKLCENSGIASHITVKGTPQQNGLAERINRILLEGVRCMIRIDGVSKGFWGEAAKIVCYVINRCLSTALKFKPPQEMIMIN